VPPEGTAGLSLAVFDLDGTITRHDTLMPFLLDCLWRKPWRLPRLLLLPLLAFGYLLHRDRGRFKGALIRAMIGGLPRAWLEARAAGFVPRLLRRGLFAEALRAIDEHRTRGDRLVLMSASIDLYVPLVGGALGFAQTICSLVRWNPDGTLDGRLASANCHGEEKRRCLQALIAREAPGRIYAYGNSGSDLPHLQLAQQGYLVNGPARLLDSSLSIQALHWSQRGSA
ncbi:MAG TPA: HAD-IB family hydrolase, partial [Steroidobacteraceae bacterium]